MPFIGETIAFATVFAWTTSSIVFEYSSKKIGSTCVNFFKLLVSTLVIAIYLYFTTGSFVPLYTTDKTVIWIIASGIIGFTICDLALFHSFVIMGAHYAQLIMTGYPIFAAITAWLIIKESLAPMAILGICITIIGVAITILSHKSEKKGLNLIIPKKGLILAFIAAICQGVGFVLSKKGMMEYANSEHITQQSHDLIPIAATQIRAAAGFLGVFLSMLLSRRLHKIRFALQQKKAIYITLIGTIAGPLVGVILSLLALQHASTGVVSTIIATQPILLMLYEIIVNNKKISRKEILGTILAVIGIILFFLV